MKKKLLSALAAVCLCAVCSQPAFAMSKAEITNVNPHDDRATYLGDGLYMLPDDDSVGGYKEGSNNTISDAVLFSKVKTIAVAPLLYTAGEKEPNWQEAMDAVLAAANAELSASEKLTIVSYEDIADRILRSTGQDILSMNRRKATQTFKKYVSTYADAYIEITIANGSKSMNLFADVNQSGTNERLYSYKAAVTGVSGRTIAAYSTASKNAFKSIDGARKDAEKKAAKLGNGVVWDLNK